MEVYTVARGDTLQTIAERFSVSLYQLIQANPQIENIDKIFPGDQVQIPAPTERVVPQILSIEFLDEGRQPLPRVGGFVRLQPVTIVRVTFSVQVSSALFFSFPTGVNTFELTQLIGSVRNGRVVEFRWEVPPALLAFFFVIGCINGVCVKSEELGVYLEE